MRDLDRAHQFIDTLSGQNKVSASKISDLDEGIVKIEVEKESEDITPEEVADIDEKIKELPEKRDLQRDHLNRDILPGLKSQFARIRETANTMIYSDSEQGITIVSVITAFGLAITTLAEAIALGVEISNTKTKTKTKTVAKT